MLFWSKKKPDEKITKTIRYNAIKSHQRRECFRFHHSLPVTVERLWQHEREMYPNRKPTEGQIINISDSGMLFSTNESIEKGERLTVTFDMGSVEAVEGIAIRADSFDDDEYKFKVAVEFRFREKDKRQKDRLYKYIVSKQIEERKRLKEENEPPL